MYYASGPSAGIQRPTQHDKHKRIESEPMLILNSEAEATLSMNEDLQFDFLEE